MLNAHAVVRRGEFELDVRLSAPAGRTLVLVGPNGAGKSTLVDALAGLLPLAAGRVELAGELLEDVDRGVRVPPRLRGVGVVFQDLRLFPHLCVADNVAYGLMAQGLSRRESRQRAQPWLERLGLASLASRRPDALSGGEAQRAALARALAIEPRLLLLDEPLSALDIERRPRARALLQAALQAFGGVRLVITHDPLEALVLADELIVLEQGRFVQSGTPDEVGGAPRSAYAASLVGVNLLRGSVRERDGHWRLVCDGSELVIAAGTLRDGAAALACVHPRAIVLSTSRPSSSARNALCGRIGALDLCGDRVRVRLDTAPPLIAEVTVDAMRELELEVGRSVWAVLKATEIDLFPY